MLKLIIDPSELQINNPISALIYGQPGVGKTSLSLSAPKPLLIDLDRGLHRVDKRFQCPSVQVTHYDDVVEALASPEIERFETIVFDTLGKMIDRMSDWVCQSNSRLRQADGTLSMKGWGVIKMKFQELLRSAFSANKNLIFVAHEKEDKDGDIRFVRPDVSGSSGKDIIKELDLMGYMEMKGNKRTISFNPTEKYYAKNSLGLETIIEIPPMKHGNTFFQDKILGEIYKKKQIDTNLTKKYEEMKNAHMETIDAITNIDDLNDAYRKLQAEEELWDSENHWKKLLKAKCDLLGATYNRISGDFESLKQKLEDESSSKIMAAFNMKKQQLAAATA